MVSLISTMPLFLESICDASTTNLFKLARDRDPVTQLAEERQSKREQTQLTVLHKINQALRSPNGDACVVFLKKVNLLFNLEVLGELRKLETAGSSILVG